MNGENHHDDHTQHFHMQVTTPLERLALWAGEAQPAEQAMAEIERLENQVERDIESIKARIVVARVSEYRSIVARLTYLDIKADEHKFKSASDNITYDDERRMDGYFAFLHNYFGDRAFRSLQDRIRSYKSVMRYHEDMLEDELLNLYLRRRLRKRIRLRVQIRAIKDYIERIGLRNWWRPWIVRALDIRPRDYEASFEDMQDPPQIYLSDTIPAVSAQAEAGPILNFESAVSIVERQHKLLEEFFIGIQTASGYRNYIETPYLRFWDR